MTDEDIQTLQAQLQAQLQEAQDQAAAHQEALATATEALAQATADHEAAITAARAETATALAQAEQATQAHQAAVLTYRDYLRTQNPLAPAELIDGADAAAVTAAAERAAALVNTVRATLAQEAAANGHVPAGAPPRTPPDLTTLSPLQKISAALARNGS